MNAVFAPSQPRGAVHVPASKSCAHRMLICAALADGESALHNLEFSEDIFATINCLRVLGAEIEIDGSNVRVRGGVNANDSGAPALPILPCHESGSTLRFLIPAALLLGSGVFRGTARLLDRGVGVYEALLRDCARFERTGDTELRVSGLLRAGEYAVPGDVSSQFISGLLFALPVLRGDSALTVLPPFESCGYVDLTLDALRRFGICIRRECDRFFIPGNQHYQAADATCEGDWSQAAFFFAMNALGGEVQVDGLNPDSLQGDRACADMLHRIQSGAMEADLSNCPDLAPALFAAAAACGHGARFTGTRRLRIKESDRAAAMARELAKFGARLDVLENEVHVSPGAIHVPTETLNGCNDHRIVMALSVLAIFTGGTIQGAEAVRKSYPGFFRDLQSLGVSVEVQEEGA